jgi:hypothetical protein
VSRKSSGHDHASHLRCRSCRLIEYICVQNIELKLDTYASGECGTVPERLFTVIILFGIEVVTGGGIHERLELTHVHLLSKCGKVHSRSSYVRYIVRLSRSASHLNRCWSE